MKKIFSNPEIAVSKFSVEDIITTSTAVASSAAAQSLSERIDAGSKTILNWDSLNTRE